MRAIAELALLQLVQTPGGTKRTAWEAALALRELLTFDFFFAGRGEFADEIWKEVAMLTGARQEPASEVDPDKAAQWLVSSALLIAHLVLRPFIDAYRVVAEELINLIRKEPSMRSNSSTAACAWRNSGPCNTESPARNPSRWKCSPLQ